MKKILGIVVLGLFLVGCTLQVNPLVTEVIPVDMRDAYAFGGGLHCCTADVYREGKLEDYFPNQ